MTKADKLDSQSSSGIDPRIDRISPAELAEGDQFRDERTDTIYELVYLDDERVLLRSDEQGQRTNNLRYLCETLDTFCKEAADGCYERVDTAGTGKLRPDEDTLPAIAALKRLREEYSEKTDEDTEAAFVALSEAIRRLQHGSVDEEDWTTVDLIGEVTSENLHDAGVVTKEDARAADDELLLNVDGMGEQSLSNLRDYIDDD